MPGVIDFKGKSFSVAQLGIERGSTDDAPIADEDAPNCARQFIFLRCGLRRKGANCQHNPDGQVFQRHFSSCLLILRAQLLRRIPSTTGSSVENDRSCTPFMLMKDYIDCAKELPLSDGV